MRFKADDGSEFPQWEEKKLGDIASQLKKNLVPKTQPDQLFLEYSMPAFDENQTPHLSRGSEMESSRKILDKPCLLINKLNVRKQRIWLVLNPGENAVSSAEFVPFASNQVDLAFLSYIALSNRFTSYLLDSSSGSSNSQKRVTPDIIEDYVTPLPSLPEQQKIAALLSAVDETLYLSLRKLDLLTQAKKALMQQIFSQKLRFKADDGSDFPEWEEKKLGDVGTFYGGLSGKSRSDFENGNARYLTYMNVYKNTFAHQDQTGLVKISDKETPHQVEYGDILFTQSSETVEEVGLSSVYLFNDRPYLNSFCMGFHPHALSELDPGYMGYCMRSIPVRRQIMLEGQGISRINISSARLSTITFKIPSLPEQQKIASCLSSADALIAQARVELEQWREVKKSLLQQLFV